MFPDGISLVKILVSRKCVAYFCNSQPMSMPSYDLRRLLSVERVVLLDVAEIFVKKFMSASAS